MQLAFQKVIKEETFSVVLELQIYTSFFATCVSAIGLFASDEWMTLGGEMDGFGKGGLAYVMTLVWTAVAWQVCSVGVVGLVFVVSSLFSNVISTLSLAPTPLVAVAVFHDKMNGVKIIAMLLGFWGFWQPQSGIPPPREFSSPVMVLDDSCLVSNDLDNFVMGEVRQFSSINNLRAVLSTEGFANVQLAYLGGLWVMIKLQSFKAKLKFMNHKGVASWFSHLCDAQQDFVAKERIVWVDIEGVPLHVWSRNTFLKIGLKWGEVMEVDDGNDDLFARKRLCIRTNQVDNILESFKIIVKGKVFRIRAKELFVWLPSFSDAPEASHLSDDESVKGEAENVIESNKPNSVEDESDSEVVSDTFFGGNEDEKECTNDDSVGHPSIAKEVSADHFNIYDLLNKRDKDADMIRSQSKSEGCNSHIFEGVVNSNINCSPKDCVNRNSRREGGSILEVLDEMIMVVQAMGFAMDGCTRDMENIIGLQGEHE
nr:probable purine permease 11 isoform X2 [Tanacetum cinerariifolium]